MDFEFIAPAKSWAVINGDGKLASFDIEACREAANGSGQYRMVAKLCLLLIAKERERDSVATDSHMAEFVNDLVKYGLRFDLNPTHNISSRDSSEEFWHAYFRRADASIRERAAEALLSCKQSM